MQPGGKPELGEEPAAALARELAEEIGVTVSPSALRPLGTYRSIAANEPGHIVEAAMFALDEQIVPIASGEIAEYWWYAEHEAEQRPIAPLTRDHVMGCRQAKGRSGLPKRPSHTCNQA